MIPLAYIQQWTAYAPWPDLRQVEQDLIICRAMCDLFNHPDLPSERIVAGVDRVWGNSRRFLGLRRDGR